MTSNHCEEREARRSNPGAAPLPGLLRLARNDARPAYSFQAAIALLAAIYVIDIIATALLIPERRGAALE